MGSHVKASWQRWCCLLGDVSDMHAFWMIVHHKWAGWVVAKWFGWQTWRRLEWARFLICECSKTLVAQFQSLLLSYWCAYEQRMNDYSNTDYGMSRHEHSYRSANTFTRVPLPHGALLRLHQTHWPMSTWIIITAIFQVWPWRCRGSDALRWSFTLIGLCWNMYGGAACACKSLSNTEIIQLAVCIYIKNTDIYQVVPHCSSWQQYTVDRCFVTKHTLICLLLSTYYMYLTSNHLSIVYCLLLEIQPAERASSIIILAGWFL